MHCVSSYHKLKNDIVFFFHCRLTLPGTVVEDGRESASYDCDTGLETIIMSCLIDYIIFCPLSDERKIRMNECMNE